jgi:hypothetical protein
MKAKESDFQASQGVKWLFTLPMSSKSSADTTNFRCKSEIRAMSPVLLNMLSLLVSLAPLTPEQHQKDFGQPATCDMGDAYSWKRIAITTKQVPD